MLILPNMASTHQVARPNSITRMFLWHIANTLTRLSIVILKVFLLAITMFLVPRTIHSVVHEFDILQEIMGRRARSPFESHVRWEKSVIVALGLLIIWHEVLRRLSYRIVSKYNDDGDTVMKKTGQEEKKALSIVSWGTVLARVIIPGMLLVFLVPFTWKIVRYGDVRELVTVNTVGPADEQATG